MRELQGGTSNVPFTYRVVAKRNDIPGQRLARLDPQLATNAADLRKTLANKVHGQGGPGGAPGQPGTNVALALLPRLNLPRVCHCLLLDPSEPRRAPSLR